MTIPFWLLLFASALASIAYSRHVFFVDHKNDTIVNIFSLISFCLTFYVGILLLGLLL